MPRKINNFKSRRIKRRDLKFIWLLPVVFSGKPGLDRGVMNLKRKVWAASPAFYVISAVMLIIAAVSYFWDHTVFYVEIAIALFSFAAVFFAVKYFNLYIVQASKAAADLLSGEKYREFAGFALPVAVVGKNCDIIWANKAFSSSVAQNRECRGENALKFIYPYTVSDIERACGTDIAIGPKRFTVYAVETEEASVLYFVDDTYYKEIDKEYAESRPVVAVACFDNREELARNASDGEDTMVTSRVEEVLVKWAQGIGGFLKKLKGNMYFILTDEKHIREEMNKKFPVLDEVRKIETGKSFRATVSVGVGRGADSPQEADAWARKALDMALGRGGDQVAVKQENETYDFFGGISKGVEKRDKVRTRVFAATMSDNIEESDAVFIMGHKFSDLDCMGSAAGMWNAAAKTLGKMAYIVTYEKQSLAEPVIRLLKSCYRDEEIFISPQEALGMVTAKSLLVVVDTHSGTFVESAELLNAVPRVIVIDHHRMMVKHIEDAAVFYHEPYASSASEMVAELVQYIGDKNLGKAEAEAMLAGIMLDTKNFAFKTGVRTFEAAAYLRRKGADTVEVKQMFSNSIEAYKTKYGIVSNAEILGGFAIASTETETDDIRIAAAQAADELLSIRGVRASFVIFSVDNTVNISARSLGDVNVQVIMEKLGGGGHLTMAGAQLAGISTAQARDRLIAAIQSNTAG